MVYHSAAILSLFVNANTNQFAEGHSCGIVAATPASDSSLVTGDYDNFGTTRYATDLTLAGMTTGQYNDWTLNATGLAAISKTATRTKFGIRIDDDIDNTAPTWASDKFAQCSASSANAAGTTEDPKLVVTHSSVTNYPLTAAQGSYTYTGQASILSWGRKITAAFGSFSLTGFDTILSKGKTLVAAVGYYTLNGQVAILTSIRTIIAVAGSFVLSGQSVAFKVGHTLIAAVGAFVLTGQSIVLFVSHFLSAVYGSFTLSGQDASFPIARLLRAAYGSFTIAWQTFRLLLNGLLAIYSNKYTTRGTSSSDKYTARGTTYSDKYTHL